MRKMPNDPDTVGEMFFCVFVVVIIFELIVWDTILQPFILALVAKISPKGRKFFSALKTEVFCC